MTLLPPYPPLHLLPCISFQILHPTYFSFLYLIYSSHLPTTLNSSQLFYLCPCSPWSSLPWAPIERSSSWTLPCPGCAPAISRPTNTDRRTDTRTQNAMCQDWWVQIVDHYRIEFWVFNSLSRWTVGKRKLVEVTEWLLHGHSCAQLEEVAKDSNHQVNIVCVEDRLLSNAPWLFGLLCK